VTPARLHSAILHSLLQVLALSLALAVGPLRAQERPHIVYILADDLGWNDVGFHGSKLRTPNLDRLALEGAVLNAFYAQPYSSQTRAALLTGRYPMRYGLQTLSILPSNRYGLPTEERTLAQALKEGGYRTAFVGKWLLGHAKPEYWPSRHGFDSFYGSLSGEVEPLLRKTAKADWRRDERPLREDGYITELMAREAVAIITRQDPATPLLLMASFNTPAQSYGAPKALLDSYRDISDDTRRNYAAAVTALDTAVGQIVAALEKRQMLANTLIVFHSDNGGAVPMRFPTGDGDIQQPAADNGVFREGQASLYEGGVRVAALAAWPGKIAPKTIITEPLHVTDLYPTLLKLAGVAIDQPKKLDGVDVWPVIQRAQRTTRKEMLLNVDDFRGAIRIGEWKLIVHAALPGKIELFDIANDPEEADNKAAAYPDRVKELLGRLNDYAYDMAPSRYLEELSAGGRPLFWRANAPKR
jgi:arylsulfatase A-like enzyme